MVPEHRAPLSSLKAVRILNTKMTTTGTCRWNDLRVAEWLGYKQRRRIRAVIHKHLSQLERHGAVVTALERPGCTEYWLNFEQAMAVCALADTPRGHEIWELVVKIAAEAWNERHDPTGHRHFALGEELDVILGEFFGTSTDRAVRKTIMVQ